MRRKSNAKGSCCCPGDIRLLLLLLLLLALGARLAFLEHDRYPMAWEQLFAGLQGLMLVGSEDRCHRDSLGQVSNHVEQQAHGVSIKSWGNSRTVLCIRR